MNHQLLNGQIGVLAQTLRAARIPDDAVNSSCATLLFLKRLTDVALHPQAAHSFIYAEYPAAIAELRTWSWEAFANAAKPGDDLRKALQRIEASIPALEGLSLFNALVYVFSAPSTQKESISRVFEALQAISLATLTDAEMIALYRRTREGSADTAANAVTPPTIRQLISRLFANELFSNVYDPAGGTASLLLDVGNKIRANGIDVTLYSQDIAADEVNYARIEAFLGHWHFDFRAGNTLMNSEHRGEFDLIVTHPPFGMKIDPRALNGGEFNRFERNTTVNSETAFLHHVVTKLSPKGRAAVLVPMGLLSRTGADRDLREDVVQAGMLEAIIALPPHLFPGTPISAAILVLRGREIAKRDKRIVIVDLSVSIEGQKTRPILSEAGIEQAIRAVNLKQGVPGFSTLIESPAVVENDYNLAVARYIRLSTSSAPSLETNLCLFKQARLARDEAETEALALLHDLDAVETDQR